MGSVDMAAMVGTFRDACGCANEELIGLRAGGGLERLYRTYQGTRLSETWPELNEVIGRLSRGSERSARCY